MKKFFLVFLLSSLFMSFCYSKTIYSSDCLEVSCSDDVSVEKEGSSIIINGKTVHVEYKQASYSGTYNGWSTTLKIDGKSYTDARFSSDLIIENENLSLSVVTHYGSISGSYDETSSVCNIKVKYTSPEIKSVTYYKINKNQKNELEKKYEQTNGFETITYINGAKYDSYYINVSISEGHLYKISKNGYWEYRAEKGTKFQFRMNNLKESSSSTGINSGSYSYSDTHLEINGTSYSGSSYVYEGGNLSFSWVYESGGGGGYTDSNGETHSSSSSTRTVLWTFNIFEGESGLANDGTDKFVEFDSTKWSKLEENEYILIKTISKDVAGIKSISATKGDSFIGESGVLYTIIGSTDNIVNTKITVVNVGSMEATFTATVKIDNTNPIGTCTLNNNGSWITNILTVETRAEDSLSGIKEKILVFSSSNGKEIAKYEGDRFPQKLLVGSTEKLKADNSSYPRLVLPDGEYQIKISVIDNVGNSSENTYPIRLDFHAPECSISNTKLSLNDNKISGIRTNFAIKDAVSGAKNYEWSVKIGSGKEIPLGTKEIANKTNNSFMVSYDFRSGDLDRSKANRIEVKVKARDNAGNEIEKTSGAVIIPAYGTPVIDKVSKTLVGENYENKFMVKTGLSETTPLNITYSYIRDISSPNQEFFINGKKGEFLKYYDDSEYRNYEKFHSQETVTRKVLSSEIFITDKIPLSYGYGHKKLKYEVYQTYEAWGNNYTEYIGKCETILSNNKPKVELVIEGTEKTEIIDVKKIPKQVNINLPETGIVNMGVRVTDYDIEDYKVELSRVQTVSFENSTTKSTILIPEAGCVLSSKTEGSKGIAKESGGLIRNFVVPNQEKEIRNELGEKIKYNLFPKPVLINYNDFTTFLFTIKEGIENEEDTESVCFYAAYSHNGLCLEVREGNYNAKGITAQVNSYVSFNIKMDDNTNAEFKWNFGDGKSETGGKVKHQYLQSEKRTSGESHYQLTVKAIKNGKELTSDAIDVFIMDTQYGELLGKEEWIGDHMVLGKIVVPQKRDLILGTKNRNTSNIPPKIMVYGAQKKEKKGCFEIKGTLTSVNGETVVFTEMRNDASSDKGFSEIKEIQDHLGWGGIVIGEGGKIELKNCEIKYADRGITVTGSGEKVKLENVYIHENGTGMHVIGGREVEVKESLIEKNSRYGIKEDKSGNESPVVTIDEKTKVKENGYAGNSEYPRDYYKADYGLKTAE